MDTLTAKKAGTLTQRYAKAYQPDRLRVRQRLEEGDIDGAVEGDQRGEDEERKAPGEDGPAQPQVDGAVAAQVRQQPEQVGRHGDPAGEVEGESEGEEAAAVEQDEQANRSAHIAAGDVPDGRPPHLLDAD